MRAPARKQATERLKEGTMETAKERLKSTARKGWKKRARERERERERDRAPNQKERERESEREREKRQDQKVAVGEAFIKGEELRTRYQPVDPIIVVLDQCREFGMQVSCKPVVRLEHLHHGHGVGITKSVALHFLLQKPFALEQAPLIAVAVNPSRPVVREENIDRRGDLHQLPNIVLSHVVG